MINVELMSSLFLMAMPQFKYDHIDIYVGRIIMNFNEKFSNTITTKKCLLNLCILNLACRIDRMDDLWADTYEGLINDHFQFSISVTVN